MTKPLKQHENQLWSSSYELQISCGLAEFFKDEPHKIALWFLTPNPNFGGVSPSELIAIRGEVGLKKLLNSLITLD